MHPGLLVFHFGLSRALSTLLCYTTTDAAVRHCYTRLCRPSLAHPFFVSIVHSSARAHLPQYGVMAPFASTTALMRRGMEDTIFAKAALWLASTVSPLEPKEVEAVGQAEAIS